MARTTIHGAAPVTMHCVILRQLVVCISYASLVVFAMERPHSLIGIALRWWIDYSAGTIRVLLFFEPLPSAETAKEHAERILAYRHVLIVSLFFALYTVMASRSHWSAWRNALNAKLQSSGRNHSEIDQLKEVGFHRMILGAVATTVLALHVEPNENPSMGWFPASDWMILRGPLLVGVAMGFILLAITFRRSGD